MIRSSNVKFLEIRLIISFQRSLKLKNLIFPYYISAKKLIKVLISTDTKTVQNWFTRFLNLTLWLKSFLLSYYSKVYLLINLCMSPCAIFKSLFTMIFDNFYTMTELSYFCKHVLTNSSIFLNDLCTRIPSKLGYFVSGEVIGAHFGCQK